MSVELYAPTVFNALNGVFCVYKPPGLSVFKLVDILRINLARGTITNHLTLGVIRSRVGRFIPGERSKIWGAAISLGHV